MTEDESFGLMLDMETIMMYDDSGWRSESAQKAVLIVVQAVNTYVDRDSTQTILHDNLTRTNTTGPLLTVTRFPVNDRGREYIGRFPLPLRKLLE